MERSAECESGGAAHCELNASPSVSSRQIPAHVLSVTNKLIPLSVLYVVQVMGPDLMSAGEERRREEMDLLIERTGGTSFKYG